MAIRGERSRRSRLSDVLVPEDQPNIRMRELEDDEWYPEERTRLQWIRCLRL